MTDERALSAPSDAALLRFERERAPLVAWLRRRVGDTATAEELAQACFLRLADVATTDADFEALLARTAKHILFERRQYRNGQRGNTLIETAGDQAPDGYPDALRERKGRVRLQQAAVVLGAMPEQTRSIFLLHRLDGLDYAEIAVRLRISPGAVRAQILEAVGALMTA